MKHLIKTLCLAFGFSVSYGADATPDVSLPAHSDGSSHESSTAVTLIDLPLELIVGISHHLPASDIRGLSLVNRKSHDATQPILSTLSEWRLNVLKTIFASGVSTLDVNHFQSIGINDAYA